MAANQPEEFSKAANATEPYLKTDSHHVLYVRYIAMKEQRENTCLNSVGILLTFYLQVPLSQNLCEHKSISQKARLSFPQIFSWLSYFPPLSWFVLTLAVAV